MKKWEDMSFKEKREATKSLNEYFAYNAFCSPSSELSKHISCDSWDTPCCKSFPVSSACQVPFAYKAPGFPNLLLSLAMVLGLIPPIFVLVILYGHSGDLGKFAIEIAAVIESTLGSHVLHRHVGLFAQELLGHLHT